MTKEKNAVHSRNMTNKFAEFVKLTDVKQICEDLILPVMNMMRVREDEAINMKT